MIPIKNVYYMLAYAFKCLNNSGYKSVETEDFENLRAKVMYHNPESMAWEPFGRILLKGPGDTDTMKHSTDFGGGLRNLRYFAVQFSDGVLHELRLNGAHNDLHIYVR